MKQTVLHIKTRARWEFIDITQRVENIVNLMFENRDEDSGRGFVHLWCPHTTAGITVSVRQDEDPIEGGDPAVVKDIMKRLQVLAPYERGYEHWEMNSDAHIAATLVGFDLTVGFELMSVPSSDAGVASIEPKCPGRLPAYRFDQPKLKLGKWQSIYFCEFDGQREREVWIRLIL